MRWSMESQISRSFIVRIDLEIFSVYRFILIQQALSIEPVSFNGLCFLGEAQHPYHGMQSLFGLASAAFSSLLFFLSPSRSLHFSAIMLVFSLFLILPRPFLPQSLQTCRFLCCKASSTLKMHLIPVHPVGLSLIVTSSGRFLQGAHCPSQS